MRRLTFWACMGLVCVLGTSGISAQETAPAGSAPAASVPRLIKFSGELHDLVGKPLTGVVDAHFAIYRAQQDAAPIWEETQTLQLDEQGRYTVLLGAMQAEGLPLELFTSGEGRWLGVAAGKLPEQPRVLLVSVPYALKAADAETLGGKPASAYALKSSSGTAPLGVALPASGTTATTAGSLTNLTGTQPKAAVSAGATEFTDTTTDQVVKIFQNGSGFGLYALARNNSAIFAKSLATSGMTFTVRGMTFSTSGAGIYGQSQATSGAGYGVRGQSVSDGGGGVLGMNTSPTGVAYGVLGITDSADGAALAARARATTGAALGVQAITYSSSGTAVFAHATAASGPTTGVLARVNSGSGTALVADNARGGKILSARVGDVEKLSVSGNGNVVASGNVAAASFSGSGAGLTGVTALTAATAANATNAATAGNANNLGGVPAASYARRDSTNTFSGNQTVNGNLTVNGTVTGTQFHGDGSGLTVSATALAAVLARLEALENIVLPPRPTGAHLWSKSFGVPTAYGTTEREYGYEVAVDKNGNILITGVVSGPVDFGGGPLDVSLGEAAVVAKFSGVDGSHLWSRILRGAGSYGSGGQEVTADASGNVFVTGWFQGTVDFGGGPLTSTSDQAGDIYVVKFSGVDGSHLWSKRFGGTIRNHDFGIGLSLAVDAGSNVLVAGLYAGTVDFGGGPLPGAEGEHIFLAKLSGVNGSHLWSKGFLDACTLTYGGPKLALDPSGNVLVTGWYVVPVDFGGGPLTGTDYGIFVAKFSGADGSHLWSKGFPVTGLTVGTTIYIAYKAQAVAVDASTNVLVTGFFTGTVDFGGGPLTTGINSEGFVAKFSGADGSHLWSKIFPSTDVGTSEGNGVAVDPSGNVLVTGDFFDVVDFGGGPLDSAGDWDIFLLKLHP